ncbi:hypothetical protein WN943_018445 [Citrus x changshan-huyou]
MTKEWSYVNLSDNWEHGDSDRWQWDAGGLEEKVVNLGVNEGLKLLKASLNCRTVLTSVFPWELMFE